MSKEAALSRFVLDTFALIAIAALTSERCGSLRDQNAAVLAAFTAGDAVFALEERAPGLGSQISQAGLQKLARGLSAPAPPAQY